LSFNANDKPEDAAHWSFLKKYMYYIYTYTCPLTKVQKNLHGDSFTQNLYKYIKPNITSNQTNNVNTFTLLLITVIGLNRLRTTKCII
jgi:hypothetical protein